MNSILLGNIMIYTMQHLERKTAQYAYTLSIKKFK